MPSRCVTLSRRDFLAKATAASAVVIAAHCELALGKAARGCSMEEPVKTDPRILGLQLLTSAPLAKMKEFYHQSLGFPILDEADGRLTIGAGKTHVAFISAARDDGSPFYHFAFNIPENKLLGARTWQKKRTELLPIPARLRDPNYPDDVVDFNHWNAHSIFFFDPAGNVVEYIARHDLKNACEGAFDVNDILYASEIGLVVDDVPAAAAKLKEVVGVDQYRGGDDQFTALGDEHGLLLVMKRGRVVSFDAKEKKAVGVFRTLADIRGAKSVRHVVSSYPYEINVVE